MPDQVIKARLRDTSTELSEEKFLDVNIIVNGNWIWIEAPVKCSEENENTPIGIEFHNGMLRNLSYMPDDDEPVVHEWEVGKTSATHLDNSQIRT